jgi:hypothetical protein
VTRPGALGAGAAFVPARQQSAGGGLAVVVQEQAGLQRQLEEMARRAGRQSSAISCWESSPSFCCTKAPRWQQGVAVAEAVTTAC